YRRTEPRPSAPLSEGVLRPHQDVLPTLAGGRTAGRRVDHPQSSTTADGGLRLEAGSGAGGGALREPVELLADLGALQERVDLAAVVVPVPSHPPSPPSRRPRYCPSGPRTGSSPRSRARP